MTHNDSFSPGISKAWVIWRSPINDYGSLLNFQLCTIAVMDAYEQSLEKQWVISHEHWSTQLSSQSAKMYGMQCSLVLQTLPFRLRPKLVGKASIKLSDKLIGPTNTNHTLFFSSLLYSGWQGSMAMDSVASNALDNITITNWTNSCSHGAGKY